MLHMCVCVSVVHVCRCTYVYTHEKIKGQLWVCSVALYLALWAGSPTESCALFCSMSGWPWVPGIRLSLLFTPTPQLGSQVCAVTMLSFLGPENQNSGPCGCVTFRYLRRVLRTWPCWPSTGYTVQPNLKLLISSHLRLPSNWGYKPS